MAEPDFAFCPACGMSLGGGADEPVLERRRVAVLFCDLVDFSDLAARTDPEDVQTLLSSYHRAVRSAIEQRGGLVEKFIGDAVMAVFGAPTAHEDDVERALDAALASLGAVAELPVRPLLGQVRARVGVHVGETAVTVNAHPAAGEAFVAGDVVNMAARLQTLASPGTTVVSAEVVAAASDRFAFTPLPPARVKGRSDPLAHARLDGRAVAATGPRPPFVGRAAELDRLVDVLDEVVATQRSGLVAVVGAPGLGKSRLLQEFRSRAQATLPTPRWVRGRSLPYGEGVTYWALSEVLKDIAGLLDTDDAALARSRLHDLLPGDGEQAWVRSRLLPLLGVDATPVERDELTAAWTRALELAADAGPLVVVLEDVHWADAALLDYLHDLMGRVLQGPVLVLLSMRPDLLRDHPGWLDPAVTAVHLQPLSPAETEALLGDGHGPSPLPPDTRRSFLERAAGNPLYALEFARLLRDRKLVDESGRLVGGPSIPVPDGVHSLVAARLDGLPPHERAVLQDASVVGKVFWEGALAAMPSGRVALPEVLASLVDHGVIEPHSSSAMASTREYAFTHAVVRDVAYRRAPRAHRLLAHLAVARWVEGSTGGRLDEVAEVLVHHASTALELADSLGDDEAGYQARAQTRRFAAPAARRAMAIDPSRALWLLDLARSLGDGTGSDKPSLLLAWAQAAWAVGRVREAETALGDALAGLRAAAAPAPDVVEALMTLGNVRYQLGDSQGSLAAEVEAAELARSLPAEDDQTQAIASLAVTLAVLGDPRAAAVADESIARARDAGQPVPPLALRARSFVRLKAGDPGGLDDADEAVALLRHDDTAPAPVAAALNGRIGGVWAVHGPRAALDACAEAIAFARERGQANTARWTEVNALAPRLETGDVRGAFEASHALFVELDSHGSLVAPEALATLVSAAVMLGEEGVLAAVEPRVRAYADEAADGSHFAEDEVMCTLPGLVLARWLDDRSWARELLERLAGSPALLATETYGHGLLDAVATALWLDDAALALVLATPDRGDRTLRGLAQRTALALIERAAGRDSNARAALTAAAADWSAAGNELAAQWCRDVDAGGQPCGPLAVSPASAGPVAP